jgi:hypothetical protein
MPDEPLALSTIPSTAPADGDYDAICAALRQSERGRQFLEEHARRNRDAEAGTVIGAIAPVKTVIRDGPAQQTQTDALAAVERLQDLAWTMREHGLDAATCEHIEILASTILSASWLRDPNDRRAQTLSEALGHLERRIDSMIAAAKEGATAHPEAPSEETAGPIKEASEPTEPRSLRSDSGDAGALPTEQAPDTNTPGLATEATSVRVPTMWEPRPEPVGRSTPLPHPVGWIAEIDEDLFAAPTPPVVSQPAPAAPLAGVAGSAPTSSPRSDPLAALKALSDDEKIALFT